MKRIMAVVLSMVGRGERDRGAGPAGYGHFNDDDDDEEPAKKSRRQEIWADCFRAAQ